MLWIIDAFPLPLVAGDEYALAESVPIHRNSLLVLLRQKLSIDLYRARV